MKIFTKTNLLHFAEALGVALAVSAILYGQTDITV